MTRSQRLRWTLLGVALGAVLTTLTWIVLWLVVSPANDVDSEDAAGVAAKWAAQHQAAGETYRGADCGGDAGGHRFVCHVRFEPTDRRFTLFMRKSAEGGDYSVVLADVRRGTRPLPDFHDRPVEQP